MPPPAGSAAREPGLLGNFAAVTWRTLELVWLPFVTSRLVMFGTGWAVNSALGYGRPHDPLQYAAPWRLWLGWDAVHYLTLARSGYPAGASGPEPGFLPLLPGLLHLVGGSAAAAMGLALVAGAAGLAVLAGLTRELLGQTAARRTAWVAAWWPLGFVWTAVYTEGLFLALAAGALWAAWRGRPWLAALLGALAGGLRLTGAGLVLPLALLLRGPQRGLALAPLAGLAAAAAWVAARTGDPGALLAGQLSGRPHLHLGNPLLALARPSLGPWELAAGLAFLGLLAAAVILLSRVALGAWRGPAWATVAGLLAPVLLAGTLSSFGRYLMVAFPLHWGLQRLPTRVLAWAGIPAALVLTAAAGNGRLTP